MDVAGGAPSAIRFAFDQLGHLGPSGVALAIERLVAYTDGRLLKVVELGSGFGGAQADC